MAALDAWTWMLRICVCFNVIYSLIEIYWVSHSRDFWKQTGPKIASLVIGGFFTAVFLVNGIVRFFQLRRSALAPARNFVSGLKHSPLSSASSFTLFALLWLMSMRRQPTPC